MISIADIVLKLIDLAEAGALTVGKITELRANIQAMQAEGRDPTPEEWDQLFDSIQVNTDRLDAADHKLNP